MSNEELALLIQQGHKEHIPQLWVQVEQFIIWKARQFEQCLTNSPVDIDDLKQSAFFAVLEAVKYFDADKNIRFLTYLGYTLKNSFRDTAGFHTSKRDVTQYAARLDAPINAEKESPLINFVNDRQAQEMFYLVENLDYVSYAREAIFRALKLVNIRAQKLITLMYFKNMTLTKAAACAGYPTKQSADVAHYTALRKIRHSGQSRELHSLLDDFTDIDIMSQGMKSVGLQRFRETWTSGTERTAVMLHQHNTHREEERP